MEELYDIYLYEGCLALPQPETLQQDLQSENEELVLFAQTLLDPAWREKLLMSEIAPGLFRRKHPGFLGVDLPEATAMAVCERFWALHTRGRIIPTPYRNAQVTLDDARQIAQKSLGANYIDKQGETYAYGPLTHDRSRELSPVTWLFVVPIPELQARGYIPGARFIYVDRCDGHIWSEQEWYDFLVKAVRKEMKPLGTIFDEGIRNDGVDIDTAGNGGYFSLDWWQEGLQQGPCHIRTYDPTKRQKKQQ